MITSLISKNWRQLQSQVAEILEQCGFDVEIEKKIQTARGSVEIDVYAAEEIMGRKNIILCECKLWKQKIPQTVVHSFRTVLSDFGANKGYIISSKGYQKGAFEASKYSNADLVTWEEFQDIFEPLWYRNYFQKRITQELDPLYSYTEPLFSAKWLGKLTKGELNEFLYLKEKHYLFGAIMMTFTTHRSFLTGEQIKIPIINNLKREIMSETDIPVSILHTPTYKEFLQLSLEYGQNIVEEFRFYKRIAENRL